MTTISRPSLPALNPRSGSIENWSKFLVISKRTYKENVVETVSKKRLDDFRLIQTIGVGKFGTVVVAKTALGDKYIAIKIIEKKLIVEENQVNHAKNEKRLLLSLSFPFILNMYFYFKGNSYIYFVMPFVNGGDIFFHLRRAGKFSEPLAVFYSSQVVLALEYLHNLDIIYRDLKPENLLLDKTGYIKVADLGFAKEVTTRTYTLCGTPDYIAPEMILNKGYSHTADWWALGVLVYEFAAGYPPFISTDEIAKFQKIVSSQYSLPPSFSNELKDLVCQLLQVDTSKRMGSSYSGLEDIKRHCWFRFITWMDVLNKKVTPPFVPTVNGPGDLSNFDELEDFSLKDSGQVQYEELFNDF